MTFSPRIVGEHRPDYHSISSVLKSAQFAGKTGEELVLALYDLFTSTEDGTWHFWTVDELQGQPRIRRFTSDPIKLLTNYGWHICGQSSCIMYGLYSAAGFKARQISIPGHLVCEVYYDDAWHVLDVDMWTWFRNKRGGIASAYELAQDAHALIVENSNKSNPCNLPDRSLEDYATMYDHAEIVDGHVKNIFPHWSVQSHQLDFYLRPGESLERSERSNGCFIFSDDWVDFVKSMDKEWCGYPRERFDPFRTYGSGHWTYAPKLSNVYDDVVCGAWSQSAVSQSTDGIVGAGQISFRMQSPYICCAKPDISSGAVVYTDGATLRIKSQGRLSVRLILEEKTIELASITEDGESFLDLTDSMICRYEAIIEFNLEAGSVLREFIFESPIMSAPKTLPKLLIGNNKMELRDGDDQSQQTAPWKQVINFTPQSVPSDLWESAQNTKIDSWAGGWKCVGPEDEGKPVEIVYCINAPTGKLVSWFHALCSVKEGPEAEAQKDAQLSWSLDNKHWQILVSSKISNSHLGWDMSLEDNVVLETPVSQIYLRVVSETAVTGVEFYGHLDMSSASATAVEIQHVWREGDKQCGLTLSAESALNAYNVTCAGQPTEHVLKLVGLSREKSV